RPLSALNAGQPSSSGGNGNGLSSPDPAANGTVRRSTWNSAATNQGYIWQIGNYGNPADQAVNPYWPENGGGIAAPTSGPTNIWEGSEFWLQFRVKISSTRWASGNVSGKLAFVNTMALTGTQEILIRSCANPDSAAPLSFNQTNPFLLYTSQGNEANSVIFQNYQGTDYNNGVIIEGGPTSPFPATCTIGN